jgi:hypothetical protein
MRVMRRAWSCAGAASSSERSDVGCPMSTMTLRPLTSTAKNLLTREVSVQFSANSSRSHDPSFSGARPQYTAVGTSMTSRTESARRASTSASMCGGGRRSMVASQKRRRRPTSKYERRSSTGRLAERVSGYGHLPLAAMLHNTARSATESRSST